MTRRPFIILALPRSRTAWLAHYLTLGSEFLIGHDTLVECASIEDFLGQFASGMAGTVETGAMLGWRLLRARMPSAHLVTVHRPVSEVEASLRKFGLAPDLAELEARNGLLEACAMSPGTQSFAWEDLSLPLVGQWLFEHLLERPFDEAWHQRMCEVNIQVDMIARSSRLWENRQRLAGLKAQVAKATAELKEVQAWMH